MMRAGFELPPLMFTRDELAALTLGARFVKAWGGARLALAAEEALGTIAAAPPAAGKSAWGGAGRGGRWRGEGRGSRAPPVGRRRKKARRRKPACSRSALSSPPPCEV